MSSTIILDNTIQEDCFSLMQPDFLSIINDSTDENWFLLDTKHDFQDFCLALIKLAGEYITSHLVVDMNFGYITTQNLQNGILIMTKEEEKKII